MVLVSAAMRSSTFCNHTGLTTTRWRNWTGALGVARQRTPSTNLSPRPLPRHSLDDGARRGGADGVEGFIVEEDAQAIAVPHGYCRRRGIEE